MSVDEARGLVFLPVSSTSPDFWGGLRKGDGRYANSVVALKIETGEVAWSFQTTHHDVWDYDIPAQPTLGTVTYQGQTAAAVLQPTKQGLLFTLDRDTGAPLIPVVERKVPQGAAPGEALSPTQPFPIAPPPLAPDAHQAGRRVRPDVLGPRQMPRHDRRARAMTGFTRRPASRARSSIPSPAAARTGAASPSMQAHDIVYVNTSSAMHLVTLIPRKDYDAASRSASSTRRSRPTTARRSA